MESKEKQIQNILSKIDIQPNPEWVANTKFNLINKMNSEAPSVKFNFLYALQMRAKVLSTLVLVIIIGLLGVGTTLHAAVTSKPGDFLFGLNKAIENIQRSTALDDNAKLELEKQILEKRLKDLNDLINSKDAAKIALAQSEVNEQQNKVNEVENRNRGRGNSNNPLSFPKVEDDNSSQQETEHTTEVETEHNGQTETENDSSGSNSGSDSQQDIQEKQTDSNKSGSNSGSGSNNGSGSDSKSGSDDKSGKDD